MLGEAMAGVGNPPPPDEEEEARIRERALRARLAEARLAAHERHRPVRDRRYEGREGGAA